MPVPAAVADAVVNAGLLGTNEYVDPQFMQNLNAAGAKYKDGIVSTKTGLPIRLEHTHSQLLLQ